MWHTVRDQCAINHDAVTQDTFKQHISSGFWEVKTVLDPWKSHVKIHYLEDENVFHEGEMVKSLKYLYDGDKKNKCGGSEYVIIERTDGMPTPIAR